MKLQNKSFFLCAFFILHSTKMLAAGINQDELEFLKENLNEIGKEIRGELDGQSIKAPYFTVELGNSDVIVEYLERGTSWTVFSLQSNIRGAKKLAVKMPVKLSINPTKNALIEQERKLLTKELSHKNILPILEDLSSYDPPNYIIFMPYMEKDAFWHFDSLQQNFANSILRFFTQIFDVLKYLKAKGYMHRDIKPENVLIDKNGDFILTDFECAIHKKEIDAVKFDIIERIYLNANNGTQFPEIKYELPFNKIYAFLLQCANFKRFSQEEKEEFFVNYKESISYKEKIYHLNDQVIILNVGTDYYKSRIVKEGKIFSYDPKIDLDSLAKSVLFWFDTDSPREIDNNDNLLNEDSQNLDILDPKKTWLGKRVERVCLSNLLLLLKEENIDDEKIQKTLETREVPIFDLGRLEQDEEKASHPYCNRRELLTTFRPAS